MIGRMIGRTHALIDDEILLALGIAPSSVERATIVNGGCGGARLLRLELRHRHSGGATSREHLVVKLLSPRAGRFPPRDPLLRELCLHESDLLADLPYGIETGVLAGARTQTADGEEVGALLLRDVSAFLPRDPLRAPLGHLPSSLALLLDRLARLHARYWDDQRLADPALGLLPPRDALLLMAPPTVQGRIAHGDPSAYLRAAHAGWETFFRLAPPAAAAILRDVLDDPGAYLEAVTTLPATLCHGDVWGPNLGWLPPGWPARHHRPRLLLLDWGLATSGPATYDPLWLAATWHQLSPRRLLALYRARLTRRLAERGVGLDPATWLALADAGYLRTLLVHGEAFGRLALRAPAGSARRTAERRIYWWAERAAAAAHRLVGRTPWAAEGDEGEAA